MELIKLFFKIFGVLFQKSKNAPSKGDVKEEVKENISLEPSVQIITPIQNVEPLKLEKKIELVITKNICLNFTKGIDKKNKIIIIHWVGGSAASCIFWFKTSQVKASAHYIVDIDGTITQMVEDNDIAWHAGASYHKDLGKSLNKYSIGIELAGPPSTIKLTKWPEKELESAIQLCQMLHQKYPEIQITDHSSICDPVGRKSDVKQGKDIDIFPWEEFVRKTKINELS